MGMQPSGDLPRRSPRSSSRFQLLLKIASGGMGTVYLGRQKGPAGFQRLVAIKRAHPHLLEDANIVRMLALEARLASLIRHPNVVGVTDVEVADGELLLVMEYVEGGSLAEVAAGGLLPIGIALRVILDVCEGLHAVHETIDEEGKHLGLVHRDVSPQNVLVGIDGAARVADLGIARASALQATTTALRGKPSYMAPEYIATSKATRSTDVFALGIVAWEALTGERFFSELIEPDGEESTVRVPAPSSIREGIPAEIDTVVLKAVAWKPEERFASAHDFANALEAAARSSDRDVERSSAWIASRSEVGRHVARLVGPKVLARREMVREETTAGPPGGALPKGSIAPSRVEVEATPITVTSPSHRVEERPVSFAKRHGLLLRRAAVVPVVAACVWGVVLGAQKVRRSNVETTTTAGRPPPEGAPSQVVAIAALPNPQSRDREPPLVKHAPTEAAAARPAPVPPPTATPPPIVATAEPAPTPPPPTPPQRRVSILAAPPTHAPENPYAE
jgi:serine/threonine protein kinase